MGPSVFNIILKFWLNVTNVVFRDLESQGVLPAAPTRQSVAVDSRVSM